MSLGCGCQRTRTSAQQESPAVPPIVGRVDQFWVGGLDGGVFVIFEPRSSSKMPLRGRILRADGSTWFVGEFVPEPPGIEVDIRDRTAFKGWDGERLLLTGGQALRAEPL